MAEYSILNLVGNGVTKTFSIEFELGFESRDQITVRVGTETEDRSFTWVNDGQITLNGDAPGDGVRVAVRRTQDTTEMAHDYQDGARIKEKNLDESNLQLMRALHELQDGRIRNGLRDNLDANGFKIQNVGEGSQSGDLATFGQLQDLRNDVLDAVNDQNLSGFIQDAEDAAEAAALSATEAATSATSASNSSATAGASASNAAASAAAAATSAASGGTSGAAAATSAAAAAASAEAAEAAAEDAASEAADAESSADAAAASAMAAAADAAIAASNGTGSGGSATAAAASATAAASSATSASSSASSASASATSATSSASSASSSATSASTSAAAAASSASNAANSAILAQTNATVYQTAAEAAATAAEGFKNDAEAAQTAAEAAQAAAETAQAAAEAAVGVDVAIGSFTKNIADATGGSNAISGFGFQPKYVEFFTATASTSASSVGFSDGTNHKTMWQNSSGGNGTNTSACIAQVITDGVNQHTATCAIDADGFTVNWTKLGTTSGTCTVLYKAIR